MTKPKSFLETYNMLRNGEDVACETCDKGTYRPIGASYKYTNCFECDNCKEKLIFD